MAKDKEKLEKGATLGDNSSVNSSVGAKKERPQNKNLKPFKKGESGNPKGYTKGQRNASTIMEMGWRVFADKILATMNEKRKAKKQAPISYEDVSIDPELDMWMKQMEKARNGDTKAFELIVAYSHGKPTAKVEVTGKDGDPIEYAVMVEEGAERLKQFQDRWFKKKNTPKPKDEEED